MWVHMLHKCTLVHKSFLAEITHKWFLSCVQCVMQVMFLSCFECLITLITRISIYRCVHNTDVTHQLFTFRVHFIAWSTHKRCLWVSLHVKMQTRLSLEARTTVIALEPSLCHMFAFVGSQVTPLSECHATNITGIGIPLAVFILTRNIIIIVLIIACITTTITIIVLLCNGYWVTPGLDSCPFQGT